MTLLLMYDFKDDAILKTALLHDTLEDTEYTYEELKEAFGSNIVDYINQLSEDKSKAWEERKRYTIEKISELPEVSKWVLMADKVNNLEIVKIEMLEGKLKWDKFNRGKNYQEWYFKRIYQELMKDEALVNHLLMDYYKELVLFIFDGSINKIPKI